MAKRLKQRLEQEARERAKTEQRTIRAQKEYEDANGIRRRINSGYNDGLSLKTIKILKTILLISIPIVYFVYSVLLLPIVVIYGLLYLPIKNKERNLNYGVRDELRIALPKFDSIIALILIVVVGALIGISSLTTSEQNSMFAGKSQTQIYAILQARGMSETQAKNMAKNIANSSASMTQAERLLTQAGTLLTGERVLFETKNADMMGLGGKRPSITRTEDGKTIIRNGGNGGMPNGKFTRPPNGAGRPSGFKSGGFGSVNIQQSLNEVFSTINIVLLLVVFVGGIFSVCAIKNNGESRVKRRLKI
jgi:hypothetical protein